MQQGIDHSIGIAPFVIEPDQHFDEFLLAYPSLAGIHYAAARVVIEITGHQFGWYVRYAGNDDNQLGNFNYKLIDETLQSIR